MLIHHYALEKECGSEIKSYEDCKRENSNIIRTHLPECVPDAKKVR